jgi:hypothetical protein
MDLKAGKVIGVGCESTARGDDESALARQLLDDSSLIGAKAGFAFILEYVSDPLLNLALNEFVGVNHLEM